MNNYVHTVPRLTRHLVTWGAFSLLPAMFAASGPPPITVNEPVAVTVTGPVEVHGSVEVLNDALKVPYNRVFEITLADGSSSTTFSPGGLTAGKRLVIETIGVEVRGVPGQKVVVHVGGNTVALADRFFLPIPVSDHGQFFTRQIFAGAQAVKMIMDPRVITGLNVSLGRNASTGTAEARFTICGYLEDLPVAAP
jgi:hypothetical protein